MTASYIGTKIVGAWPEEKDGAMGYAIEYPDGYRSWCPAGVFAQCYRRIEPTEAELIARFGAPGKAGRPIEEDL